MWSYTYKVPRPRPDSVCSCRCLCLAVSASLALPRCSPHSAVGEYLAAVRTVLWVCPLLQSVQYCG